MNQSEMEVKILALEERVAALEGKADEPVTVDVDKILEEGK
ncbi:hypothetical protein J2755_000669 [Methanohalophilus levihalophilus]|nr:hypothetical protein [Methanohalophilus levihalophilus]MBP2029749.1 hypothetical protein [Methanohalophilus levihalophilus]